MHKLPKNRPIDRIDVNRLRKNNGQITGEIRRDQDVVDTADKGHRDRSTLKPL